MSGKNKITFLLAAYNEEHEIIDLLGSVFNWVDKLIVVDDGSTDDTATLASMFVNTTVYTIEHTGLCEVARIYGLERVTTDWVLMMDADERISREDLEKIREWVDSDPTYTHMYFTQDEYIDGVQTRSFQKPKLFRKDSVTLSPIIHSDMIAEGEPVNIGLTVTHRKTSAKQRMRELQYLDTYKRLVEEGAMTQEKADWCRNLHYFER